jgi:hypothetical protein
MQIGRIVIEDFANRIALVFAEGEFVLPIECG